MVVSAMGKKHRHVGANGSEISEAPPGPGDGHVAVNRAEQVSVALMAMAIDSLGYQAVSLTGSQIGIKTDSSHTGCDHNVPLIK